MSKQCLQLLNIAQVLLVYLHEGLIVLKVIILLNKCFILIYNLKLKLCIDSRTVVIVIAHMV
jgi:hypothetical protein